MTTTPQASAGLIESWLEAWATAGEELVEYLADTGHNGPRLLNLPRWWREMSARTPPRWSTPHEVVFELPLARLRDFSARPQSRVVPTLVLPPQAGHDSSIVDFSPEQSQVRTILAAGLERTLSLDWLGATRTTADASIGDYLDVIDRAIDHAGGRVNLIGDCQGGWLATIYAALRPERVNTLTIAGAPIDFHAGEPVIHEVLQGLAPAGQMGFYEALVALGGGVLKGEHMLSGLLLINPGDEIGRQLSLLRNLDDPAHVARYREFEDWFKHTQDIPGAFYLWIVRHLFRDNKLVRRILEIDGAVVDLRALEMPLNLMAGSGDHITPPAQVFALAQAASTGEARICRATTDGGHLGLFMGRDALRDHWPALLAAIRAESTPRSPAGPRRRSAQRAVQP